MMTMLVLLLLGLLLRLVLLNNATMKTSKILQQELFATQLVQG